MDTIVKRKITKLDTMQPMIEEEIPQSFLLDEGIGQVIEEKKEIKTIQTKMTMIEGKPFIRLFGWGIFLEGTSKKENADSTRDVIIKYQGDITPQKLDYKIISWE